MSAIQVRISWLSILTKILGNLDPSHGAIEPCTTPRNIDLLSLIFSINGVWRRVPPLSPGQVPASLPGTLAQKTLLSRKRLGNESLIFSDSASNDETSFKS